VRSAIRSVTLAAAGLVAASAVPLARDAITSPIAAALAGLSFLLLARTRIETLWVIAGSAAVGLLAGLLA
jgi:chromate transport protein ChrA